MSAMFGSLLGFVEKISGRKGKILRRKRSLDKSSAVRRGSKAIVDLSSDANAASGQQSDHDRTDILAMKRLSYSNGSDENDAIPLEATYQTPFGASVNKKSENASSGDLDIQLVCLKESICEELRDETKATITQLRDEIRKDILSEVRQEIKRINRKY